MMGTSAGAAVPLRDDLVAAVDRGWAWLARPGTWLSAREKIAAVDEARAALTCELCHQRKEALSPYTLEGRHDGPGVLAPQLVEVVHRIRTDSGRLTRSWYERVVAQGVNEGAYVELIGVVATAIALDTFDRGLGRPRADLPQPMPGEPSRYRPAGARHQLAWVPTLEPDDITPADPDIYARYNPPYNIQKALSLVPDAMLAFFDLDETFYLQEQEILNFAVEYRAISHDQMELIAARLSALNRCYY